MTIRAAVAGDLPRILAVRHAAFAAQAPAAYSPTQVATLLADVDEDEVRTMIDDGRMLVAVVDGEPAGCAGWQHDRLRHVYVSPAYTRRGLASALVRSVERELRARTGHRVVRAGVARHAEPFYRAIGYRVERHAVAWDGSGYLEMVRELPE